MATLVTEPRRKTPARLASSAVLAMQSDDRLVQLARDGHERAFDAIVSRYRATLVRYCGRILPESRTEDAVQQAFINAHVALQNGEQPVQLRPWLYTITRNAALNMLRQNGWNYEQIPLEFDGVRRPDQVVEQRIELQNTVAAVNDLPDRQRDAIVMRELEGRSYQEIALALGANDGAVRQLLNRARGTLRTAVSALMPPPLVARAASSLPPTDGRRMTELLASVGAGGAVKVGATALVAGSLVVGAVNAPLPLVGSTKAQRDKATLTPAAKAAKARDAGAVAANSVAADHGANANAQSGSGQHGRDNSAAGHNGGARDKSGVGNGHSGSSHSGGHEHAVFYPNGREDHQGDHSSPTESHSGSGDHSGTSGGSGERSGTSGGSDGSTSHDGGGSGTSGSSEGSTTLTGSDGTSTDSSVSGDSGTSGSGSDSGTSGSSGSGSSDSGSSDSTSTTLTSTSGTSGSDGSGSTSSGSSDGY